MSNAPATVIVAAKRTPIGAFQGQFADLRAAELGGHAIRAAVAQSTLAIDRFAEIYLGCVLQAGQGQAPARQAALKSGLPRSLPATTINKMCGSGLKAVMFGCDAIGAGVADAIIAGGTESMSNAPYLLPKARQGYRMGHQHVMDHMFFDGLQDAYEYELMGVYADRCAEKYRVSRADQDQYAALSVQRAIKASDGGYFREEIIPVTITARQGEQRIEKDETISRCDVNKIPKLNPVFSDKGTVTAATSSSIADGAVALVLMGEEAAKKEGLTALAIVKGYASHAQEPGLFITAPVGAIQKLMNQLGWKKKDVDLFEINEAFAVVTLIAIKELALDVNHVNIHGGACALGHPIGASGARILTTLIYALKRNGLKRGIASLCIGGGEACALAVEIPEPATQK